MSYEIDRVYTYHLQKGRLVRNTALESFATGCRKVSEALEELEKCGWKAVHVQYKRAKYSQLSWDVVYMFAGDLENHEHVWFDGEVNDYVRKNGGKLISHVAMNRRTARISRSGVSHFDSEGTYHPPVLAKIED